MRRRMLGGVFEKDDLGRIMGGGCEEEVLRRRM